MPGAAFYSIDAVNHDDYAVEVAFSAADALERLAGHRLRENPFPFYYKCFGEQLVTDDMNTLYKFYSALENHDWTFARALLQDNFRFRGPMQQADSADSFIATNQQINPEWKFQDVKMVQDANLIMSFFTTVMTRPAEGTNRCAERVEVRDGKLQSIELIYDSAGFRQPRSNAA